MSNGDNDGWGGNQFGSSDENKPAWGSDPDDVFGSETNGSPFPTGRPEQYDAPKITPEQPPQPPSNNDGWGGPPPPTYSTPPNNPYSGVPYDQQQGYGNYISPQSSERGTWLTTGSYILAALGLLCCCVLPIPIFNMVGIALGWFAMKEASEQNRDRTGALGAFILNIVITVIGFLFIVLSLFIGMGGFLELDDTVSESYSSGVEEEGFDDTEDAPW